MSSKVSKKTPHSIGLNKTQKNSPTKNKQIAVITTITKTLHSVEKHFKVDYDILSKYTLGEFVSTIFNLKIKPDGLEICNVLKSFGIYVDNPKLSNNDILIIASDYVICSFIKFTLKHKNRNNQKGGDWYTIFLVMCVLFTYMYQQSFTANSFAEEYPEFLVSPGFQWLYGRLTIEGREERRMWINFLNSIMGGLITMIFTNITMKLKPEKVEEAEKFAKKTADDFNEKSQNTTRRAGEEGRRRDEEFQQNLAIGAAAIASGGLAAAGGATILGVGAAMGTGATITARSVQNENPSRSSRLVTLINRAARHHNANPDTNANPGANANPDNNNNN